jgi:hypothetical protein
VKRSIILAACAAMVSGCTLLPVNVGTLPFMQKKKEVPPMVAVTDFETKLVNRHGVRLWIEQPVWGDPISVKRDNGGYQASRVTTNRPLVQVYVDSTLTGSECRWESFRLQQVRNSRRPNDFDFGSGVERDAEDWHGDGQYFADCANVKAMIKDDARYSSALKK